MIVLSGYADGRELAPNLEASGDKSRRLIAIAGSNQPDTAERPGLLIAVRVFMREHPEWSVVGHCHEGTGLTIISCDERDKPKLPGKITMASNLAQGVAKHVVDGATKVDQTTLERRLAICTVCEHRNEDRCSVCGCFLAEKAAWRSNECPLGKWEDRDATSVNRGETDTSNGRTLPPD